MKRARGLEAMPSTSPFQRLQVELSKMIASTQPGTRLPSEPELSRKMGVSRATLREAMRTFEAQGLIRRRQGMGTFVVSHSHIIESGLEVLQSIENLARQIQLQVFMGDLQISEVAADDQTAQALQVPLETPLIQVARVIFTEDRPVAYLIDILPENILSPKDLQEKFTGSVLDFLLRRGSPPLAHSLAEIQAVPATSEIARLLQIQRGDALLLFIARLFDTSNRVVDYSYSYFLPGYFRFHVVRRVENQNFKSQGDSHAQFFRS